MPKDIFISYSSKDQTIAFSVCKYLEENNLSCWIAPRDILPSVNYGEALLKAIENCKIFVLILSSSSNSSHQVIREIERAISKGIKVLPFRIENVLPSKAMEYFISSSHWLDAFNETQKDSFIKLRDAIYTLSNEEIVPNQLEKSDKSKIKNISKKNVLFDIKNAISIFSNRTIQIILISIITLILIVIGINSLKPNDDVGIYIVENKISTDDLIESEGNLLRLISERFKEKKIPYFRADLNTEEIKEFSSLQYIKEGGLDDNCKCNFILGSRLSESEDKLLKFDWIIYDVENSVTVLEGENYLDSLKNYAVLIENITNKIQLCVKLRYTLRAENLRANEYYLYREGRLLLFDKDENSVIKAMANFKTILKSNNNFIYANLGLAKSYLIYFEDIFPNAEYLIEAEKEALHAKNIKPYLAESYEILGRINFQKNDFNGAIKNLKKAIEIDPSDISSITILGWIYGFHLNKPSEATYYFVRAKQIDPLNPTIIINLANFYGAVGNYANALIEFEEASKIDETYPDLWKFIGVLYDRQSNYPKAIEAYQKAILLNPTDYESIENLVGIYFITKKFDEVKFLVDEQLKVYPKDYRFYYLLGLNYLYQENNRSATEILNIGLQYAISESKKNRTSAIIKTSIALFYARLKLSEQAENFSNQAFEMAPDNSNIIIDIAGVYSILMKKEKVLKYFEMARTQAPDFDEFYLRTAINFENFRNAPDLINLARN